MMHLTENDVVQIKGAARLQIQSISPQHVNDYVSTLSKEETANRYQQLVCEELSKKMGQDVNEFLATLPELVDQALANRDFKKVKQLTVLKSQIFDLMF